MRRKKDQVAAAKKSEAAHNEKMERLESRTQNNLKKLEKMRKNQVRLAKKRKATESDTAKGSKKADKSKCRKKVEPAKGKGGKRIPAALAKFNEWKDKTEEQEADWAKEDEELTQIEGSVAAASFVDESESEDISDLEQGVTASILSSLKFRKPKDDTEENRGPQTRSRKNKN